MLGKNEVGGRYGRRCLQPLRTPHNNDTVHKDALKNSGREEKDQGNMASALEGCVGSLRASMQNLDSTINILDDGVSDMPRLAKVLQTTRVRTIRKVSGFVRQSMLITTSTSNSSPNQTSKQRKAHCSRRSAQKSTTCSNASKTTSTSSSAVNSHSLRNAT